MLFMLVAFLSKAVGTAPIGAFPGYTPGSVVSGSVVVSQKDASTLSVSYHLMGVTGASGGLRIYNGTSCAAADGIGVPYWDTATLAADPWTTTNWGADDNGAVIGTFDVVSGYTVDQVLSHTAVVFQGDDMVGCGVLVDVIATAYNAGTVRTRG